MRAAITTLNDTFDAAVGLTATAGGTKAAALKLVGTINQIAVCATAADSVILPLAKRGMPVFVINDGAASCQVYGVGTDTIDAVATATGKALANGKRGLYVCHTDGAWVLLLGA
jgi:hypothetical protein